MLEDFILLEKITHFDHERILERIIHARGSAAHGYFQPYKDLSDITKAAFLCDPEKITPVFVRFSTVQGGAGSADTVRISAVLRPNLYRRGNFRSRRQ
ncbi:catalase [Salmonella enterica]|uniref:catalase n=1 Tax=Salmonella enterica TaxID=28901 RepID=UPI0021199032|nr:catalase [Salmonella enterica]